MENVELNKKLKISPHFTLGELCKTSVNSLDGNIPSRVAVENLKRVCEWLEELRRRYNERYFFEEGGKRKEEDFSRKEEGGKRKENTLRAERRRRRPKRRRRRRSR